jgi:uncharacterized protein YjiS (DUF1127 family)
MAVIHLQPGRDGSGAARRRDAIDALGDAMQTVIAMLRLWYWRNRERNQLAQLDDRMLSDIGLSHADREFLVNKPFWRE